MPSQTNTATFISYFNVKEVDREFTTHTLTLGSVRNGKHGSFAAFSIQGDNGPAANHFVLVNGEELPLNVQALADFMGMEAHQLQFKFDCEDQLEDIQQAADSRGSIRVSWQLLAAPGKVSKPDKKGRTYYSFNVLVTACELGSYWVDPTRKLDQEAMYAALVSNPAPRVDPMAALRARVANDRAELAAKRAAEQGAQQVAASTPAAPAAPAAPAEALTEGEQILDTL